MDADSRIFILSVVVLLFFAAYFAICEIAFASCSHAKIRVAAERGDERAEKACYVIDNFETAISTLLICTNIVHLSIATLVTVWVTRRWGLSYVSISTIITTLAVFFAGEMLPKSAAKKNPDRFVVRTASTVRFFMRIFGPIAFVLTKIGLFASRLTKGDPEVSVTEDELLDMFEDLAEEGIIDEDQEDIMSSVLEFTDTKSAKMITRKKDVVGIDINTKENEILEKLGSINHSRIVVYDGDFSKIVGVLNIREYLKQYLADGKLPKLKDSVVPPYYVSTKTNADELIEEMSRARQNIALVKGINNQFLGLVSIEDILEELVGDIFDESDEEGGAQ